MSARHPEGLNARQRTFVNAYTCGAAGVHGNATKAAGAAGYRQPHVQGSRLLKNVRVSAAIEEKQAAAGAAAELSLKQYVQHCLDQALWYRGHGQRPDSASVRALELAGRALGYLERREPATSDLGPVGVEILPRGVALIERTSLLPGPQGPRPFSAGGSA